MMKKKHRKKSKLLYIYSNDKYFIIFVIVLIVLIISLFSLAYYKSKDNEKKMEIKRVQEEKIKKLEKRERAKYKDIVFLGDSLIDFYDLDKYYDIEIVNSGVAGWTTDDILDNLDEKVFKYYPKKLLLLIGTNDLNAGKDTDYIVNNIKKIIKSVKEKRPYTKIYIESLYPVNNTKSGKINLDVVGVRNNDDIQKINTSLNKYCKKNNYVYINMYDELIDDDNNLKLEYTNEGLHMSDKGYDVITRKLKKYVE